LIRWPVFPGTRQHHLTHFAVRVQYHVIAREDAKNHPAKYRRPAKYNKKATGDTTKSVRKGKEKSKEKGKEKDKEGNGKQTGTRKRKARPNAVAESNAQSANKPSSSAAAASGGTCMGEEGSSGGLSMAIVVPPGRRCEFYRRWSFSGRCF
jgi:hypothetical protein